MTEGPPAGFEAMIQRFLARENEQHQTLSDVRTKQDNLGRTLEAMQIDVQRVMRMMDGQAQINDRQIALTEQTANHAKTFERAFEELKALRQDIAPVKDSISQAKGGLRIIVLVGALLVGLISVIGTTWRESLRSDLSRLEAKHERDNDAMAIKHDAHSQQIQELRIARQRDIEKAAEE